MHKSYQWVKYAVHPKIHLKHHGWMWVWKHCVFSFRPPTFVNKHMSVNREKIGSKEWIIIAKINYSKSHLKNRHLICFCSHGSTYKGSHKTLWWNCGDFQFRHIYTLPQHLISSWSLTHWKKKTSILMPNMLKTNKLFRRTFWKTYKKETKILC